MDAMWDANGKDPFEMCRLNSAFTMEGLEKKEKKS